MRWTLVAVTISAVTILVGATGCSADVAESQDTESQDTGTAPQTCLSAQPEPIEIETGSFTMGCDSFGELVPCYADERPAHLVNVDAFRIDATEVTVSAYRACVDAGACTEPTDLSNADCNYPVDSRPMHPVNCLAWSQADTFCKWAGGRLPTEAEWEKAARGADQRMFAWGDELPTCDHANFSGCSPSSQPVGCYPAGRSAYGAYDMAGNVAEFLADWYDNTWYARSPADNPTGPETGENHVARGGSYYDFNHFQRATFRGGHDPSERPFDYIGFRCAYAPK